MKEAEMESGFYWVKWQDFEGWEPAEYIKDHEMWCKLGINYRGWEPTEIGPRIAQYTDTL